MMARVRYTKISQSCSDLRRTSLLTYPAHCTEIDFALSFGAVLVKMIDWSKTESRDFFGVILGQENSQKLYLLPKSC